MTTLRPLRAGLLAALVLSLTVHAPGAPATTQVPAGSTAAIGPAAAPATPDTPQGKMLKSALTPETRKTLQEAMDSAPAAK